MSNSVRPHRRKPTRLPCPWDSPGKNTGVGCHFLLQCRKVKSESEVAQSCLLLATPWTAAYQAPPSMGFFQARVVEWGCHCLLCVWLQYCLKKKKVKQKQKQTAKAVEQTIVLSKPSLALLDSLEKGNGNQAISHNSTSSLCY